MTEKNQTTAAEESSVGQEASAAAAGAPGLSYEPIDLGSMANPRRIQIRD